MPKKQYIKRFGEWIKLKKIIHYKGRETDFSEGEVWWCGCGENVGVEINGKNRDFSRPVLIFRKLDKKSFMAIPLTSQYKRGTWYVPFRFQGRDNVAVLAQAKVMSVSRLYNRKGEVDDTDMAKIMSGFHDLYCVRKRKNTPHR